MLMNPVIPASEKSILRDLAKKQLEYAKLPIMAERKRDWILHNRLEGKRPLVVLEENNFTADILPPPRCTHPLAAEMEKRLCQPVASYEVFDDDKVVPDFFPVYFEIGGDFLGLPLKRTHASEGPGYHIEPLFDTLEEGLPMMTPTGYIYDKERTELKESAAQEIFGDILPVVRKNSYNYWHFSSPYHIVTMMGMENMYCAIAQEGDNFHRFMRLINDDFIRCLKWQADNGLLLLNNGNDYTGSGNFCFSDELPADDFAGTIRPKDLWGHCNGQECIGISPENYAEFIYPYFAEISSQFGLFYYGCCEPVHQFWDTCLKSLPNMRKVSISPWCDEEFMGERLAGGRIIYSRHPVSNFLGVNTELDEEAFTSYIKKTAMATKGRCKVEFLFRDIYTLNGNRAKARKAVDITRHIAETMY